MKLTHLAVASLMLSCSSALINQPKACPTIAVLPHALLEFTKPLAAAKYDVELNLNGDKESCVVEIGESIPAKEQGGTVQGPMTQTNITCKLLSIAGVGSDGSISTMRLAKPEGMTSVPFTFKMSVGGVVVAESDAALEFIPTETLGEGCGRTDVARLTLTQK